MQSIMLFTGENVKTIVSFNIIFFLIIFLLGNTKHILLLENFKHEY